MRGPCGDTLITFARNVLALIYNLSEFTDIPVTEAALLAGINAFATAKSAQPSGGKAATATKNDKRDALIALLKTLANFVQQNCNNNLALLLSTGFEAVSTNRAQYPLEKPMIERIAPGMTGISLVTLTRPKVARGCEIRVTEIAADGTPGEFRVPFFSSTARNVPVEDLIPGVLYGFQGGAICLRLCGMRFATRGDSLALELNSESPKSMRGQWLAQSSLYWRSMDPADLSPPLLGALLSGNFFWQSVESSAVDAFRAGQSIC